MVQKKKFKLPTTDKYLLNNANIASSLERSDYDALLNTRMIFIYLLNILVTCLLPKLYHSDLAFIHLNKHSIISMATFPRHWKNYIDTFIIRYIIKEEIFDSNVLRCFHNFQMAKKFITLGNKILTSKDLNEETCNSKLKKNLWK